MKDELYETELSVNDTELEALEPSEELLAEKEFDTEGAAPAVEAAEEALVEEITRRVLAALGK